MWKQQCGIDGEKTFAQLAQGLRESEYQRRIELDQHDFYKKIAARLDAVLQERHRAAGPDDTPVS
jgi:hypothetical protein